MIVARYANNDFHNVRAGEIILTANPIELQKLVEAIDHVLCLAADTPVNPEQAELVEGLVEKIKKHLPRVRTSGNSDRPNARKG